MENKTIKKVGNYFSILLGIVTLLYAVNLLVTGSSDNFHFRFRDLQLWGIEAIIVNFGYLLSGLMLVIYGLRGIIIANKTKT